VPILLLPTLALGDVVVLEFLPPGTAAWFCTNDKFNLTMFRYVCQAETNAQERINVDWTSVSHHIAKRNVVCCFIFEVLSKTYFIYFFIVE
jgi:hypothetical protein